MNNENELNELNETSDENELNETSDENELNETSDENENELNETSGGSSQTVIYQSETIDYTEHFIRLENLGYFTMYFCMAIFFFFCFTLVYKFIKSFF